MTALYFKGHHKEVMLEHLRARGIHLPRSAPVAQVRAVYFKMRDKQFYDFIAEAMRVTK